MGQVETGCSMWYRWDWDRRVSILGGIGGDWVRWVRVGGTGWEWDKGVFQLNQLSTSGAFESAYENVFFTTIFECILSRSGTSR